MARKWLSVLTAVVVIGLLSAACAMPAAPAEEAPAAEVEATEAPAEEAAEAEATEAPAEEAEAEATEAPAEEAMGESAVIAEGFNAPQGILVDPDGNVWVIDSGVGGEEDVDFFNTQAGEQVVAKKGDTTRVVRVNADGSQDVVATLPSLLMGMESLGGARLALLDGALYATVGQGAGDPAVEALPNFGGVVRIDEAGATLVASTWDFERAENPDATAAFDSHPYGLAPGPDGMLYVADAGANDLLRVDPASGEVSLVAVFDAMPGVFPSPTRNGEMLTDPVPTGVAFDDDGNAYVALLSGAPFIPGSSKVVMVAPDGTVSDYATGFTMLTDLRRGPDGNLYGVQIGEFSEQGPVPNVGKIVRINGGEDFEVVADGLAFPTSVDFNAAGDAFVVINGGFTPPGAGAVITIPGLAAASE
jgi:DNA-binding beta-propeller fold protein YncE